jgi:methylenetetrahydrofolate dehydrogenase (NADP+)/methenyltetrahydrofolate cyclohydrolase/formyltetrahydrofolate synthetase
MSDVVTIQVKAPGPIGHTYLFRFLYSLDQKLAKKIEIIAKEVYGAAGIEISPDAAEKLERYERQGFGSLPICMAKTHLSLSHDPSKKGAPTGRK